MKRLFAILLICILGLAPAAARCEFLAPAACPMASSGCCSSKTQCPAHAPTHNACSDCTYCPAVSAAVLFSASDKLVVPAVSISWLRHAGEETTDRTDQPPVPPPRS